MQISMSESLAASIGSALNPTTLRICLLLKSFVIKIVTNLANGGEGGNIAANKSCALPVTKTAFCQM